MARIYSHDGYVAADGLRGCRTCDEAFLLAKRLADEWDEAVELEDDDGTWRVYPIASDGSRDVLPAEPDDYAVCDACGQHAVHHGASCHD